MIVYFNGQFLEKSEVRISPDDRGFLFADGVYEVVRAYDGRIFKAAEHFVRLERSLRELRIALPAPVDFTALSRELLQRNQLTAGATVYLQITRGAAPRTHFFPDAATPPTIYATASPFQAVPQKGEHGVKVILLPEQRWTRCDIKSVSLLPNILGAQQAKEQGAEECVFIRDGALTEGSRSNFAAVFDGQFHTYPQNNLILGGITRDAVLRLCRDLHIPVCERPVPEANLKQAQELMLLGTTTEVMPIVQVNDWKVGDAKPGPVTRRLQAAFRDLVAKEAA
jgi:D-alanine transaminase